MLENVKVIQTFDVPSQVDLQDLQDQNHGRLLAANEAALLKKAIMSLPPTSNSKRFSKKELGVLMRDYALAHPDEGFVWHADQPASYGIIREFSGVLFAVYKGERHGKELGSGAFGKAKLVQNIQTGEWAVLKVLEHRNVHNYVNTIQRENQALHELGIGHGDLMKREAERQIEKGVVVKVEKYNMVMDYAKGKEIYDVICGKPQLSAVQWLDIALQSVQTIHEVHKKGYLHRDIKLENLLYDLVNNKVTAVDFGLALKMRKDGFVMARRAGTAEYMAPEIELATGDVAYSTAVDVYALGVLLQQIFGFRGFADTIDKEKFNKLAQQFHPRTLSQLTQAETNKLYEQSTTRTDTPFNSDRELERLLLQMTDPSSKNRPALPEVIRKLQKLRENTLPIFPMTMGIVQIDDYKNAKDKKAFLAALKSVDVVILADNDDQGKDVAYYTKMRKLLEKENIAVRKEVLISNDPASLISKAHRLDQKNSSKQDKIIISNIFYFQSPEEKINLPTAQQHYIIEVNKNNIEDYRKVMRDKQHQSQTTFVSEIELVKVQKILINEINRLHKSGEKDTSMKIKALAKVVNDLEVNYERRILTYNVLHKQLSQLDRELFKQRSPTFFKSKTLRTVQTLKNKYQSKASKAPQALEKAQEIVPHVAKMKR